MFNNQSVEKRVGRRFPGVARRSREGNARMTKMEGKQPVKLIMKTRPVCSFRRKTCAERRIGKNSDTRKGCSRQALFRTALFAGRKCTCERALPARESLQRPQLQLAERKPFWSFCLRDCAAECMSRALFALARRRKRAGSRSAFPHEGQQPRPKRFRVFSPRRRAEGDGVVRHDYRRRAEKNAS